MADFDERRDLTPLSEDELWIEIKRVEGLAGTDDLTDATRRRGVVAYLKRLNDELGKRRGSRSGNGSTAVE